MTKFSIITVCFNEAENISKTCESIVSQRFEDFEWIVIDGGSTDGTLETLSEYRTKIRCLISEPDNGVYHAMNKGIVRARGEYLLFLNGGDLFAGSDVLDIVSKTSHTDLIYGDLIVMEENGSERIVRYPDVLEKKYFLRRGLPHQASFFSRELFEEYGLYDTSLKITADADLFLRLILNHKISYTHVDHPFSIFTWGGLSSQNCVASRAKRVYETHRLKKKFFRGYRFSKKGIETAFKLKFRYRKYL